MFPRCRQIARAAIKTEKASSSQKSVPVLATIKSTAIGRTTAAMIEANEVYRLMRKTATQATPPETNTRSGNALPAFEAEPNGVVMTQDARDCGGDATQDGT